MIPDWIVEGQKLEAPKGLWIVVAESRSTGDRQRVGSPALYAEAIAYADAMNRSNQAWFYHARPILDTNPSRSIQNP